VYLILIQPFESSGLIVAYWASVFRCKHEITNIMVLMSILMGRFDDVDVQVDRWLYDHELGYSCFFNCLSECNPGHITVTVRVSAGLQPALKFDVK
jgi:hypothetical protein